MLPTWAVVLCVYAALLVLSWLLKRVRAPGLDLVGKHVVVTGGSSGLGKAIAALSVKRGAAQVTLVARNQAKLDAAKIEITEETACDADVVQVSSCDVTNTESVKAMFDSFDMPVDVLVCAAGVAQPGYILAQSDDVFRRQMEVNYFGHVACTRQAVLQMLRAAEERGEQRGHVVLVGSAMSLLSYVGYGQYAPSKMAMRAFAEALRHEVKPLGIRVTAFYPSNMDTPGFAAEQRTKPEETQLIEGTATLFSAQASARTLFDGMAQGDFAITQEFVTHLIRIATGVSTPRPLVLFDLLVLPFALLFFFFFALYVDVWVMPRSRGARAAAEAALAADAKSE
ncbi:MAG: hypothetical protein MHM6MM_000046 [Cercozoa sp. M6MM]